MKQNDNIEFELMEAFTSEKSDKDIGMPDIEQELALVKEKHGIRIFPPMRKIAASVAIIMALGGITLAAVVNGDRLALFFTGNKEMPASAVTKTSVARNNELIIMPSDTVIVEKGDITFDDSSLADIMTSISNNYNINVEFNNKEQKAIRLHFKYNTSDSLEDVVKALNMFEKIKVRHNNEKLEVE
jgi:hypothetical protein